MSTKKVIEARERASRIKFACIFNLYIYILCTIINTAVQRLTIIHAQHQLENNYLALSLTIEFCGTKYYGFFFLVSSLI